MHKVGSYEAKTHLSRPTIITKHGVPIPMLVPVEKKPESDLNVVIEQLKAFSKGRGLGNG